VKNDSTAGARAVTGSFLPTRKGEFVAATTAANAGVPPQTAGLAAALFNASQWIGGALGLAVFSAIATARTTHLLAAHAAPPAALDAGFHQALIAASVFMLAAALFALRTTGARGEPDLVVQIDPTSQAPAASDLTNQGVLGPGPE
jgi:hypothetical protein